MLWRLGNPIAQALEKSFDRFLLLSLGRVISWPILSVGYTNGISSEDRSNMTKVFIALLGMTQLIDETTDVNSALEELQKLLPQEGYGACVAYLGDKPFLQLHIPIEIWDHVKDHTGWKWIDEVNVTLPFAAPHQIDGFRIMLEWYGASSPGFARSKLKIHEMSVVDSSQLVRLLAKQAATTCPCTSTESSG